MATFGNFAKRQVADRVQTDRDAGGEAEAGSLEAAALPDDLVEVGVIVDAYGVKGWVKVQPHAVEGHGGDALIRARRWWLAPRIATPGRPANANDDVRGPLRGCAVSQSKAHSGSVVAHVGGFTDRDQALGAKGSTVYVRRADFAKLSNDEFYWVDLIGLSVVNTEDRSLGQVVGMIDNGAHSVMRVAVSSDTPASEERLIPFVDVYVRSVDIEARQIVVDWGLDY
ncbi:MAG TPA: ribosome maturation factor RimM [Pararobbsia sp.]|nr:ribosome maturation factor RimM [Pararobbsia sp.]